MCRVLQSVLYIFINQYPPICYGKCSICLNQLYSDQDLDTLPCGHHFHDMCIHLWYYKRKKDRLSCRQICKVSQVIMFQLKNKIFRELKLNSITFTME